MTPDVVTPSVADHIATVTLDRPPVNAVNAAMRHRLVQIFDEITTATTCAWRC